MIGRIHGLRATGVVLGVLLAAYGAGCGPPGAASDTPTISGVSAPGLPEDLTGLDRFEADTGKRAGVVMYYQGWARHEFRPDLADAIRMRGSLPMITWEPWDADKGVNQPAYRLARIRDGAHDAYILRWANAIRTWGHPLLLRFAHEMNGDWYPWAEGVNGNARSEYVAAWRHVRDVFRSAGVTNVSWVWSPNVVYRGSTALRNLYPGDHYTDWVAADGYNGGTALDRGGWRSFRQVFDATLEQLRSLTDKPMMLGEVASTEVGGDKGRWIADFFAQLRRNPRIKAFVWFNWDKETDWRVQSSERARNAYAAGLAHPRYVG